MSTSRRDWPADTVRDALNAHLRPTRRHPLRRARRDDFNARISARERHYLYRIVNRRRRWRSTRDGPGT